MLGVPGVTEVHDLHIWTITSGMESLSAHVMLEPGGELQAPLAGVRQVLREQFNIDHVTIQVDPADQQECESAVLAAVEEFNGLRRCMDAMTKWRRKSLFCEPCLALLRSWRG